MTDDTTIKLIGYVELRTHITSQFIGKVKSSTETRLYFTPFSL